MKIIDKLLFLLSVSEKKQLFLLLVMIIIMALLEMMGVISILPFMMVLTNPDLIDTNLILNYMFKQSIIFGVENDKEFLFALGLLVFLTLLLSLAFKSLVIYKQVRFVHMREYSIGKRIIESYLNQPYSWFLSRHTAEIGKTLLSEVVQLIQHGFRPLIEIISKGMVAFAIISVLVLVDLKLSLLVGFLFAGSYGLIFLFIRNYLFKIGKERLRNNELRFKSVAETFSAIKHIKLSNLEETYIKKFSDPSKSYASYVASSNVFSQLPKFILEAVAFGSILLLILFTMTDSAKFNNSLPIISFYTFAGYRLLPALQQIYASLTQLSFISPSLDKLFNQIKNFKSKDLNEKKIIINLNKKICLENIHFKYPNSEREILKDVNITIPAKSIVGLIGTTGSGKTTIVDIILGLLEPQDGTLKADDLLIKKENLRSWQKLIGYVPQKIFLSDDSVEANIAFGEDIKNINQQHIENVSKTANLHEFILNEMPYQYQTKVGEDGIRLSGGQRQRIGIARALYHNPKILVLDEATSALDNETEKLVMESILNISKNITVIIIAHRLNTIKKCNIVYELEKGKIKNIKKTNEHPLET